MNLAKLLGRWSCSVEPFIRGAISAKRHLSLIHHFALWDAQTRSSFTRRCFWYAACANRRAFQSISLEINFSQNWCKRRRPPPPERQFTHFSTRCATLTNKSSALERQELGGRRASLGSESKRVCENFIGRCLYFRFSGTKLKPLKYLVSRAPPLFLAPNALASRLQREPSASQHLVKSPSIIAHSSSHQHDSFKAAASRHLAVLGKWKSFFFHYTEISAVIPKWFYVRFVMIRVFLFNLSYFLYLWTPLSHCRKIYCH